MSKDNGGPAFPSHGTMGEVVCEGMTLRDYLASRVMAAQCGNKEFVQAAFSKHGNLEGAMRSFARQSYVAADAMLEARK